MKFDFHVIYYLSANAPKAKRMTRDKQITIVNIYNNNHAIKPKKKTMNLNLTLAVFLTIL